MTLSDHRCNCAIMHWIRSSIILAAPQISSQLSNLSAPYSTCPSHLPSISNALVSYKTTLQSNHPTPNPPSQHNERSPYKKRPPSPNNQLTHPQTRTRPSPHKSNLQRQQPQRLENPRYPPHLHRSVTNKPLTGSDQNGCPIKTP